ncbi:hypothetical protein ACHQM5_018137 [Ranunculus cassubicifolius]
MEDSFKVKVDKAFSSLAPDSTSSLWSLTDEEAEKKQWNHENVHNIKREKTPCSTSFAGFFSNLAMDDGEENEAEEAEIRACIGLDSTLDNEQEEDEADVIALGKEITQGNHVYMKDVNEEGSSYAALPDSCKDHVRDSRAGFTAARIRVKEDDGENTDSILKRRDNKEDEPEKRVKVHEELATEEQSSSGNAIVPDYIRNPQNYTKYSFEPESDVDESSNQQAYMDFLNMIKGSQRTETDERADLSKPIVFVPRKKSGATMKDVSKGARLARGVTMACVEDTEAGAMEEEKL